MIAHVESVLRCNLAVLIRRVFPALLRGLPEVRSSFLTVRPRGRPRTEQSCGQRLLRNRYANTSRRQVIRVENKLYAEHDGTGVYEPGDLARSRGSHSCREPFPENITQVRWPRHLHESVCRVQKIGLNLTLAACEARTLASCYYKIRLPHAGNQRKLTSRYM